MKQVRNLQHINKSKYYSTAFWKEIYQNCGKGSLENMRQTLDLRINDKVLGESKS